MEAVIPEAPLSYTAPEAGSDPLEALASTVCLLTPRQMVAAGFDAQGTVLAIRYGGLAPEVPDWDATAFEDLFLNEALLADPALLSGAFFADERVLVVPRALYSPEAAAAWLGSLHHVTPDEVAVNAVQGDAFAVVSPFPAALQDALAAYFGTPRLQPLSAAVLQAISGTGLSLTLAGGLATAALHRSGRLLWHGAFRYDTPEDIAYRLHTACREHGVLTKTVAVQGMAATVTETGLLHNVLQYFPATASKAAAGEGADWQLVSTLMHRLRSCAS